MMRVFAAARARCTSAELLRLDAASSQAVTCLSRLSEVLINEASHRSCQTQCPPHELHNFREGRRNGRGAPATAATAAKPAAAASAAFA
eukprot:3327219-Pleurochrysis_carterae.AAC.1